MSNEELFASQNDFATKNKTLEEKLALLEAKEESLRRAQEIGNFGSWEIDLKTKESTWSEHVYRIYGLDPKLKSPSLDTFFSMVVEEDKEKAVNAMNKCTDGEIHSVRIRIKRADGEVIHVQINAKNVFDKDGKPSKLVGTTIDVTEQAKLHEENLELALIIEESSNEVYIIESKTFRYLYANKEALKHLGYTREELYEMNIFDINRSLTKEVAKKFESILYSHGSISNRSVHTRKDGTIYPVQSYIQRRQYKGNEVGVLFDIDISKRVKAEERIAKQTEMLSYQAFHDHLTQLPNRTAFNKELISLVKESKEINTKFALLFIDLDNFKQINDTLGHHFGDEVLKIVSKRLDSIAKESDSLFRIGGDEFVVLVKNINSPESAKAVAERVLNVFKREIKIKEYSFRIGASIGIALYPQDSRDNDELFRYADLAMYDAKNSGKNRYSFFNKKML